MWPEFSASVLRKCLRVTGHKGKAANAFGLQGRPVCLVSQTSYLFRLEHDTILINEDDDHDNLHDDNDDDDDDDDDNDDVVVVAAAAAAAAAAATATTTAVPPPPLLSVSRYFTNKKLGQQKTFCKSSISFTSTK